MRSNANTALEERRRRVEVGAIWFIAARLYLSTRCCVKFRSFVAGHERVVHAKSRGESSETMELRRSVSTVWCRR
jgi:hypothetical protein